jgi:hypothetical protein
LQAGKAAGHKAFAPDADRVPFAVQFGGDLQVAGTVVVSGA